MITLTPEEERDVLQRRKDVTAARQRRFRAIRKCLAQIGKREQKRWKAQYRCGMHAFLDPKMTEW